MTKEISSNFMYGVQYYRAPTPLPEEWEYDLQQMDKTGIDLIQLRIQWRWHETIEGKYEFKDIDRLFELAKQYDKKVIIKFMMETAPDYIFAKYDGVRKDNHGLPISPFGHGAFYVGGRMPCFENPDVMRKALEFVEVCTLRYKDMDNLILWNIWNEPRSTPVGDCCCKHSVLSYRNYLKSQYASIDALNKFFGKKWESFDTINPPGGPYDYVEFYLWRKWAMNKISKRLGKMYNKVKSIDPNRQIVAHVGHCSILQDVVGDSSDDILNSSKVDFYGTSLPVYKFTNVIEDSAPFMVCDWLRHVSDYYWVYELYPDWGHWQRITPITDYKMKVWSSIACGAKGILYWQYRAERLGNEENLAGLVNIDGSFKEVSKESKKVRDFIDANEDFLVNAKVKHDKIGILYSLESDLINRIENTGKGINNFDFKNAYPYLYKKSLFGAYALFRELGFTTQWIDTRKLKETLKELKVIYIPECFMMSSEVFVLLKEFAETGGYVIAEEGIGLRQANTWVHPTWPGKNIAEFFGVSIIERVSTLNKLFDIADDLTLMGQTFPAVEYISYLECDNATVIGNWSDGRIGATQKDNLFYIGTSLSSTYHDNYADNGIKVLNVMSKILDLCGIKNEIPLPANIYKRTLIHNNSLMHFIFNRNNTKKEVIIKHQKIIIEARDIAVVKTTL